MDALGFVKCFLAMIYDKIFRIGTRIATKRRESLATATDVHATSSRMDLPREAID